jgi:anaerobic nitric oxide reductase transcription regulator
MRVAIDLSESLPTDQRYQRLVAAVQRVLPADAVALLKVEGEEQLVPLAVKGLDPNLIGRCFRISEHPRFERIVSAQHVVRFAADDPMPDPYDGHVHAGGRADGSPGSVHSCLGAPLRIDGELVGCLTVDAIEPGRFESVDDSWVETFAALAAATMRTALLIDELEHRAAHQEHVAQELVFEALARHGSGLVGSSEPIRRLHAEIDLASRSGMPVLVHGETGTGKELVARTVHARSGRARRPLVSVNCAALPETIAESELFGHMRGAFTGAVSTRPGRFEVAHEGTLFLDEVGELPLSLQPLLLRAVQFGEIQRVGAARPQTVDVWLIAATNRDLEAEVRRGAFREDLFHRINAFPVRVPSLREHREDIPMLVQHFLDEAKIKLGLSEARVDRRALAGMAEYAWPGNVRELHHVILRAAVRASNGGREKDIVIGGEHLDLSPALRAVADATPPRPVGSLTEATEVFQRQMIHAAVEAAHGNWAQAARDLQVDKSNLHRLALRLGLKAAESHSEPPASS